MNKIVVSIWAGVIVLTVFALVLLTKLDMSFPVDQTSGAFATQGGFGQMDKFIGNTVDLSTTTKNATSTSFTNSDSGNRYVTGVKVVCNGLGTSQVGYIGGGLSSLTLSIGTTSSYSPASFDSFSQVASLNISTTTSLYSIASSTTQLSSSSAAIIWHTGENMTFYYNATNTASCSQGVEYIVGS